jgi:aryl-alcohol dehydrogenase-like predicted oxidoreductase
MEYLYLGNSGLRVSKFVFGTVTFSGANGFDATGHVVGAEARRHVETCIDAGINAFDTSNLYSFGGSETVLGEALDGLRQKVLIFSKVGFRMSENPNDSGASRVHINREIDKTLKRLNTDYIDLYFTHLWDGRTPVEETCDAMTSLIKAGKIRYWGVSNYSGWSLAKTVMAARANGLAQPVTHQLYYTPEAREAEYELLPAGADLGVSAMIWSPLGMGYLAGRIDRDNPKPAAGTRLGADGWKEPWIADQERLFRVIDVLKEVGAEVNASIPQVTLAWIRQRENVGPIVIGARTDDQLAENLKAADLKLTAGQCERIEAAGRPAPIYPLWHRCLHTIPRSTPSETEYLLGYRKTLGVS